MLVVIFPVFLVSLPSLSRPQWVEKYFPTTMMEIDKINYLWESVFRNDGEAAEYLVDDILSDDAFFYAHNSRTVCKGEVYTSIFFYKVSLIRK